MSKFLSRLALICLFSTAYAVDTQKLVVKHRSLNAYCLFILSRIGGDWHPVFLQETAGFYRIFLVKEELIILCEEAKTDYQKLEAPCEKVVFFVNSQRNRQHLKAIPYEEEDYISLEHRVYRGLEGWTSVSEKALGIKYVVPTDAERLFAQYTDTSSDIRTFNIELPWAHMPRSNNLEFLSNYPTIMLQPNSVAKFSITNQSEQVTIPDVLPSYQAGNQGFSIAIILKRSDGQPVQFSLSDTVSSETKSFALPQKLIFDNFTWQPLFKQMHWDFVDLNSKKVSINCDWSSNE